MAIERNVSRQNIIKDETLVNIATAFPKDMEEMKRVRGVRPDVAKSRLAKEMTEILASLTEDKFDRTLGRVDRERDVTLPPSQHSLCEVLKLLLKIKSNDCGVVSRLITSEKNLREYIKNPKAKIRFSKAGVMKSLAKRPKNFARENWESFTMRLPGTL